MRLRRIGNRILRRSRISLGNWSFTPKSVPFSSLPRLFTCSFCLKYPNLATIGRGLGAPGSSSLPSDGLFRSRCFSTVSSGSFRYVLIKFLTVASGSSSADSGMPENTRLSLMLRAWRSMTVSFIFLLSSLRWVIFSVRDLTESRRDAFSAASVSTCCWLNSSDSLRDLNSRCRISTRDNLASKLDNRLSIESRMSVKLLPVGDCCFRRVCWATSFGRRRLAFGWRTCILVFLHDYNVEAPVDVFLKSF